MIVLFILTASAEADTLSVHCPNGCPSNPSTNDLVFTYVYALSNNPTTKFADCWVTSLHKNQLWIKGPGKSWRTQSEKPH